MPPQDFIFWAKIPVGLAHATGVHERNTVPYARFALKKRHGFWGVSWCCGNYCLLAFVLWCGYCSVSFQSFVLRHWCPQHQETTGFCAKAREKKHAKAQIRHTLGTVKARFKYC